MEPNFNSTRVALFTFSYAGHALAGNVKKNKNKDSVILKLSQILFMDEEIIRCFVLHKTCCSKFSRIIKSITEDKEKVKIYLAIEKELLTIIEEKRDKESFVLEDYKWALLDPAIERVAGNDLSEIEYDRVFERRLSKLQKTYHRRYYFIAYKYKLPTIRIVPFLLRLLSINP